MAFLPSVEVVSRLLLDVSAKATVLLIAAWLATALLARSSAAIRHRVWSLTMIGLVLLPVLSGRLPAWRWPVLPALVRGDSPQPTVLPQALPHADSMSAPRTDAAPEATLSADQVDEPRAAPIAAGVHAAAPISAKPSRPVPWLALLLVGGWLLGLSVCLGGILLGLWRVRQLSRHSQRVGDEAWRRMTDGLRTRLGLRRTVELREYSQPIVPLTWGFLRPRVLLPPQARTWTEPMRRAVLLHELAHVQRGDVAYQLLGRLACALYWFHPLAWLALRQLRQEREQACDDAVLHTGEQASAYAEQLLEVARLYCRPGGLSLAVEMAQGSSLEQRLRALFDAARSHNPLNRRTALGLFLLTTVSLCALAIVQPVERGSKAAAADREESDTDAAAEVEAVLTRDQTGRLVLEAGRLEHALKVIDQQGEPVSGAKLTQLGFGTARGSGMSWQKDWPKEFATDDDGVAVIEAPDVSAIKAMGEKGIVGLYFSITHPDHPPKRVGLRRLDDQTPITLDDGLQLTMRVVRAGENRPLTKDVFLKTSGWLHDQPVLEGTNWIAKGLSVSESEGGRYLRVIHAPPDQPVSFSAFIDLKELFPKPGSEQLDVVLHPGVRVRGNLAADIPRPVKGGRVSAYIAEGPESYGWQWAELADIQEDGSFVFESLPRETSLQLIACCDGWVSESPANDELQEYAQEHGLDIRSRPEGDSMVWTRFFRLTGDVIEAGLPMVPTEECEVTVVDAENEPLAGAEVHFFPNQFMPQIGSTYVGAGYSTLETLRKPQDLGEKIQKDSYRRYAGKTDAEGRVAIRNLPRGSQGVGVTLEGYEIAPDPQAKPDEWRAGWTSATIQPGEITRTKIILRRKVEKKTSAVEPRALERQIDAAVSRVIVAIRVMERPFLKENHLAALRQELGDFLSDKVRQPVPADHFASVLAGIDALLGPKVSHVGELFHESRTVFQDFEILKWHLWTALDPVRLSPDELARRDAQRDWFRRYLKELPDPYGGKSVAWTAADGTTIRRTAHESKLNELEEVLTNPLHPFFAIPLADAQFQEVQQGIRESRGFTEPIDLLGMPGLISHTVIEAQLDFVKKRWPVAPPCTGLWWDGQSKWHAIFKPELAKRTLADLRFIGQAADEQERKVTAAEPAAATDSELADGDVEIVDVQLEGNEEITDAEIRQLIKVGPGQSVTSAQISQDVEALVRTRWFAVVEPSLKEQNEGRVLIYRVVERPMPRGLPVHIVLAEHVMLWEGTEIVTWEQIEQKLAAFPDPARLQPQFHLTQKGAEAQQNQGYNARLLKLKERFNYYGYSIGTMMPRSYARYDRIRTAADLIGKEANRVEGRVLDKNGRPVAEADVLLIAPLPKEIPYRTYELHIARGRVPSSPDHIMTKTDAAGRFRLLSAADENFALLALHPDVGFASVRKKHFLKETDLTLSAWAGLTFKLEDKPEDYVVSLSARESLQYKDDIPEISLHIDSGLRQNPRTPRLFRFEHVPAPFFETIVSRTFPDRENHVFYPLRELTVDLAAGEQRTIGLGPLTKQQREDLESRRRRTRERIEQQEKSSRKADPPAERKVAAAEPKPATSAGEAGNAPPRGTIRGTVLRESTGKPEAGVEVCIIPQPDGAFILPLKPKKVTTGANGEFLLEDARPGTWLVYAFHEDVSSRTKKLKFENAVIDAQGVLESPVQLTLRKGVALRVKVRSELTGRPIPDAFVQFGWTDLNTDHFAADEQGEIVIPNLTPEQWHVEVAAAGHARIFKDLKLTGPETLLEFSLFPGGELRGVVVTEDGEPLAGAAVSAQPAKAGMYNYDRTKTDEEGRYRLAYIPQDQPLRVSVSAEGYQYQSANHQLNDEELNFTLLPIPDAGNVAGRVVDRAGRPIAGAKLSNVGMSSAWVREAVSDKDGNFQLEHLYFSSQGAPQLVVRAEGFAPQELRVAEKFREGEPLELTLQPGHRLRGRVVNHKGKPVGGCWVYYNGGQRGFGGIGGKVVADGEGRFEITSLPETCELEFSARGYSAHAEKQPPLDREEELTVTLSPMGTILGVVLDEKSGAPVLDFTVRLSFPQNLPKGKKGPTGIISTRVDPGESFVTEDGRFRLEGLDDGATFDLIISGPGYEEQHIEAVTTAPEDTAQPLKVRLRRAD